MKHGKPSTIIRAAERAGEVRAAQRISEQAMANAARLQEKQMSMDYQMALRKQDIAIDLQMNERAKMWEIEKMEISSRIDFQREEQARQKKLDGYDNIDAALDKEVQSGRATEEQIAAFRFQNKLARQGSNVSVSAVTQLLKGEDERYGVRPYYLEPEFERDYPELAEAKKKEVISGQRAGTIPYYLDPTFIGNYPEAARQAQEARGIFLSDEEFADLTRGAEPTGLPLDDKSLDVGVRAEQPELIFKGYGKDREEAEIQKSPYPEYPDAFLDGGVWKVIRDGKTYRIED